MNWEEIKRSRFEGFVETAEYYLWMKIDRPSILWSKGQLKQIKETINNLNCFGEIGERYAKDLESVI